MVEKELFERIEFTVNQQYERIIDDLAEKHYCIVDDFFSAEEIERLRHSLLEKYEEDYFKKSAIGNRINELVENRVRGDFILWINEAETKSATGMVTPNEAENMFFSKINDLVNYLNRTCFMGILHKEFHYAVYPEGTFYKRHLDTFQNDGRRKLSIVCYLNDSDWKRENGGELVIYSEENEQESATNIYPFPGRLVIFESQVLEHEVKPVIASERFSITGWLKTR